jgi:hypothetical protein
MIARGPFEVETTADDGPDDFDGARLGRWTLEKRYHGDLEATSEGRMLTAGTGVEGSAGYVAVERVSGRLQGRVGSFVLLHFGLMGRGEPELRVEVVPDSGTGGLTGLSGRMAIRVGESGHAYEFEYAVPPDGAAPS